MTSQEFAGDSSPPTDFFSRTFTNFRLNIIYYPTNSKHQCARIHNELPSTMKRSVVESPDSVRNSVQCQSIGPIYVHVKSSILSCSWKTPPGALSTSVQVPTGLGVLSPPHQYSIYKTSNPETLNTFSLFESTWLSSSKSHFRHSWKQP